MIMRILDHGSIKEWIVQYVVQYLVILLQKENEHFQQDQIKHQSRIIKGVIQRIIKEINNNLIRRITP